MKYIPESAQVVRAFMEAEDIARRVHQPLSSAHLLLALFTFPNRAQVLLDERGVNELKILDQIRIIEDEPSRLIYKLRERSREIARGSGCKKVDCLHLVIAITRLRDAFAYSLLQRLLGPALTGLRNTAVSYVTGNLPHRYRKDAEQMTSIKDYIAGLSTGRTVARTTDNSRSFIKSDRNITKIPSRKPSLHSMQPEIAIKKSPPSIVTPTLVTEGDEFDAVAEAVEAALEDSHSSMIEHEEHEKSGLSLIEQKPAEIDLEEIAPVLASCAIDLIAAAREGGLDRVIGRERELEAIIDVLGKRRSNNPVLVGPPGVGKTAIVEGLAVKIVGGDEDVAHLADKLIVSLDTGSLVAGTSLRGAFTERLNAIKSEVAEANGKIIVFIDELHTLMGAGSSGEGPQDAANELKTALARGDFPCIGATTTAEFTKHIEKDPALERRFSPVEIGEPSVDETILMLEGAISVYSEHHKVTYALDAIHATVKLSQRFVPERNLPDKAFAIIDLAGSRARRRGASVVTRHDIARVIHEWSEVPLDRLIDSEGDRLGKAEELISAQLIGHTPAIQALCRCLRRGFAGFTDKRPMGSFLFLGPTGVGKTELVKILAEFLFGHREAIVRLDMSELSEKHAVSRLVGAQPGYVGYEEGGQLTEALRKRPFQIVLFDEIEKAHPDILNLLLQILDEGHLTDSRGRKVSFANTVVILTSNLGAEHMGKKSGIGFGKKESSSDHKAVLDAAKEVLSPELWGRLDERMVFAALRRDEVAKIAELQLRTSANLLFAEREIGMQWQTDVVEFLLKHGGFSPKTGARGMRAAIQRFVEGPIAEQILAGDLRSGDSVSLLPDDLLDVVRLDLHLGDREQVVNG